MEQQNQQPKENKIHAKKDFKPEIKKSKSKLGKI